MPVDEDATFADCAYATLRVLHESPDPNSPETRRALDRIAAAASDPAKMQALLNGEPEADEGSTAYVREGTPLEYAKHKFSSTQFNLDDVGRGISSVPRLKEMAVAIPDADLADDGREAEFHVTVKYGLHTDDADEVRRLVSGFGPVRATLGKTSIFAAKETEPQRGGDAYDVVKVDVDSPDLHRLNKLLSDSLEHTDTHPVYKPHVTLAYVKPGLGKKYIGNASVEGRSFHLHNLIFSDQEGETTAIPLSGRSTMPEPKRLDHPDVRALLEKLFTTLDIPEDEIEPAIEEAKTMLEEERGGGDLQGQKGVQEKSNGNVSIADHPAKARFLALAARAEREGDKDSANSYRKQAAALKTPCEGDCRCAKCRAKNYSTSAGA